MVSIVQEYFGRWAIFLNGVNVLIPPIGRHDHGTANALVPAKYKNVLVARVDFAIVLGADIVNGKGLREERRRIRMVVVPPVANDFLQRRLDVKAARTNPGPFNFVAIVRQSTFHFGRKRLVNALCMGTFGC